MSDARDRVLALLDEPGSRTKASLQDQLTDEFEPTEVTRALGKLLHAGEIEEHPEVLEGCSPADSLSEFHREAAC